MSEDRLRELGRDLPWDRPDRARREAVRTSLLVAAEAAPPRRRRSRLAIGAAFAGGALAAAAVAVVVVRLERAEPPLRARIIAGPAAVFERSIAPTATGRDEIVQVHAGRVRIDAPPSAAAIRLRLQTRDATIDGVGEYEVDVAADRLASVVVRTGSARIAIASEPSPVFLSAGETWRAAVVKDELLSAEAPPATARVAPADDSVQTARVAPSDDDSLQTARVAPPAMADRRPPDVSPAPPRAAVDNTPPAPALSPPRAASDPPRRPGPAMSSAEPHATARSTQPAIAPLAGSLASDDVDLARDVPPTRRVATPIERHFQVGWTLLRAGKPREAAIELGLAADAADRDPLAVDARYFQAIAWIRAGEPAAAETALLGFLDRAPTSLRRGRATVALARLIAERGDHRTARPWFESALRDPDPAVVASARAGIAALRP